jgi:hypothetical protein
VADISGGRKGHDQKERSIGNIDVGVYEIHGMHASSRNANDRGAGTKKEHLTALVTREINKSIE